jgi:hypothetical protein
MGLYQQWLRYQDVERSLRKTRKALEEELAQLESQLDTIFFEQLAQHEYPLNTNPILSALLTALDSPDKDASEPPSPAVDPSLATVWGATFQPGEEALAEDMNFLDRLHTVFAALQPTEVELFYAVYRQWLLQEQIVDVRQRLAALQEQLGVNERRIQHYQPSPIALASLVRLQSNGVNDIELLDQMLDRGEGWLDATMQRLDYCEQFENFLSDDYTQWCHRALDGAFDWIDSLRVADVPGVTGIAPVAGPAAPQTEQSAGDTEDTGEAEAAILLQKLSTEADDADESCEENKDNLRDELEATLKQAAVILRIKQDERPVPIEHSPLEANESQEHEGYEPIEAELIQAGAPIPQAAPDADRVDGLPDIIYQSEDEEQYREEPLVTTDSAKKPGAMRRLVGKLLGG